MTAHEVPPSYRREYEFANGKVRCLAKLAQWIPGDPHHLYTYGAEHISVDGLDVHPPSQQPEDSDYERMRACTTDGEVKVVIYFLETWAPDAEHGMVGPLATIEVHELAHLAVPDEDNETGPEHWGRWNAAIADAVRYVTDNGWSETDLTPATEDSENAELRQVTLDEAQ